MRNRKCWLLMGLLAATSLNALAGCGSKPSEKITVKGRVCYRGEPLNGGVIVFAPDGDRGNNGDLAKGVIESDGTFSLKSDDSKGIAAGWYRVAIAPHPSPSASATPTASDPYPAPPSRYRNPQLSGLQGEVKRNADNQFEFQLDDS
jgi:hypothetical protein